MTIALLPTLARRSIAAVEASAAANGSDVLDYRAAVCVAAVARRRIVLREGLTTAS
jgi:hypothetical protein